MGFELRGENALSFFNMTCSIFHPRIHRVSLRSVIEPSILDEYQHTNGTVKLFSNFPLGRCVLEKENQSRCSLVYKRQ